LNEASLQQGGGCTEDWRGNGSESDLEKVPKSKANIGRRARGKI